MLYTLKASKDDLYKKGFHYNALMSDRDSECYSIRFPVHKYKQYTTLECEVTVQLESGKTSIDVFNYGTRNIYSPYYYNEYSGENEVLKSIQDTIDKQIKKLGIKKKKK